MKKFYNLVLVRFSCRKFISALLVVFIFLFNSQVSLAASQSSVSKGLANRRISIFDVPKVAPVALGVVYDLCVKSKDYFFDKLSPSVDLSIIGEPIIIKDKPLSETLDEYRGEQRRMLDALQERETELVDLDLDSNKEDDLSSESRRFVDRLDGISERDREWIEREKREREEGLRLGSELAEGFISETSYDEPLLDDEFSYGGSNNEVEIPDGICVGCQDGGGDSSSGDASNSGAVSEPGASSESSAEGGSGQAVSPAEQGLLDAVDAGMSSRVRKDNRQASRLIQTIENEVDAGRVIAAVVSAAPEAINGRVVTNLIRRFPELSRELIDKVIASRPNRYNRNNVHHYIAAIKVLGEIHWFAMARDLYHEACSDFNQVQDGYLGNTYLKAMSTNVIDRNDLADAKDIFVAFKEKYHTKSAIEVEKRRIRHDDSSISGADARKKAIETLREKLTPIYNLYINILGQCGEIQEAKKFFAGHPLFKRVTTPQRDRFGERYNFHGLDFGSAYLATCYIMRNKAVGDRVTIVVGRGVAAGHQRDELAVKRAVQEFTKRAEDITVHPVRRNEGRLVLEVGGDKDFRLTLKINFVYHSEMIDGTHWGTESSVSIKSSTRGWDRPPGKQPATKRRAKKRGVGE